MLKTIIGTWLEYRSDLLVAFTGVIIIQFVVILLLLIYAIVFHHIQMTRENKQKQKNAYWYRFLFQYFEGEIDIPEMKRRVSKRDHPYFLEFMKHFFLDIQGTEREKASQLLVELGLNQFLVKMLKKRDESNRLYAIYFLGLIGDRQSISLIRDLIRDSSNVIRLMTASTLMQLRDTESIQVIMEEMGRQGNRENKSQLTSYLMEFGPGVLNELEQLFKTQILTPWITEVCMDVFGHYVYISTTGRILEIIQDHPEDEVRIAGVRALSQFEDPDLYNFFIHKLNDNCLAIQAYSVRALGLIGNAQAIPYLKKMVYSPDFWVTKRAIEALHVLGDEGTSTLHEILADDHSERVNHLIAEIQTA